MVSSASGSGDSWSSDQVFMGLSHIGQLAQARVDVPPHRVQRRDGRELLEHPQVADVSPVEQHVGLQRAHIGGRRYATADSSVASQLAADAAMVATRWSWRWAFRRAGVIWCVPWW